MARIYYKHKKGEVRVRDSRGEGFVHVGYHTTRPIKERKKEKALNLLVNPNMSYAFSHCEYFQFPVGT